MTRRRRIQIVLLLLAISGVVIHLANREPSYDGRALSSWMQEFDSDATEDQAGPAYEAIQHMGASALPYVLEELRRKDSKTKQKLMEWNDKLETWLDREVVKLRPAVFRRLAAVEAIGAIGTNAIPAIPEISRNLTDKELAETSANALARIGQPAFATINELAWSTNQGFNVQ